MADEKTYYAWTDMKAKNVKRGDTVTASSLGVSDAEFNGLAKRGSIRTKPYPKNIRTGESPRQAMIRAAKEAFSEAQDSWSEESFEPVHNATAAPEVDMNTGAITQPGDDPLASLGGNS